MKNQILKHLRMMPKFDDLIATKNQNDIELKFSLTDSRTVSCYASLVKVCLLFLFFLVLVILVILLGVFGREKTKSRV
jgi:hypothetical protein